MLQYGLFNNNDDENKSKVKGAQTWDEAIEMVVPDKIKEYMPYTGAHALKTATLSIFIGIYCSLFWMIELLIQAVMVNYEWHLTIS